MTPFIYFELLSMIVSGLFSIKLIGNKFEPAYMRNFYFYPLIGTVLALLTLFSDSFVVGSHLQDALNNGSILFHFTFLGYFLLKILTDYKLLRMAKIVFGFFFILTFSSFLMEYAVQRMGLQSLTFAIANSGLVLLCCFYYFQAFVDAKLKKLSQEPAFWVVTGIFFGMAPNVPIESLRYYLIENISRSVYLSIGDLGASLYGLMYLFFIKAYLCVYRYEQVN